MKCIAFCFTVFLCLSNTYSNAADETNYEKAMEEFNQFSLFSNCQPVDLSILTSFDDKMKLDLSREAIREAIKNNIESRLRSAHLYGKMAILSPRPDAYLRVSVEVASWAFSITLNFKKWVKDPLSQRENFATTWEDRTFGTHSRIGFILSALSQKMDKFLVNFLRVNDEACRKKK